MVKTTRRKRRVAEIAKERTDSLSYLTAWLVRWRARLPGWRTDALRKLAETEATSVHLLEAARSATADARLRGLFARHIQDETKHAALFRARWQACVAQGTKGAGDLGPPVGQAPERMSILDMMALFEIGEVRGFQTLSGYKGLFRDDPETLAVIDTVLRDERFHATYVHHQLERWRDEGWEDEVAAARSRARRQDIRGSIDQFFSFVAVLPRLIAFELSRLAGHTSADGETA